MKRLVALAVALGVAGCSTSFTDYMVPGYTPHAEGPSAPPSPTVQPAYAPPQPQPPPQAPSPVVAGADDLRALTKLRDDGLITEQEYQAKKAEILRRM